ncbi:MAG: hypothetical protein K8R07_04375 [Desulfobacterales bacterium]|nr:hypothetical protein [Desulfobacterales bacterium]
MRVIFNLSTRVAVLWAFEIKLISIPGKEDLDRLNKTADMINADKRVLLSRTKNEIIEPDTEIEQKGVFFKGLILS